MHTSRAESRSDQPLHAFDVHRGAQHVQLHNEVAQLESAVVL